VGGVVIVAGEFLGGERGKGGSEARPSAGPHAGKLLEGTQMPGSF
jgi:hypothetical protein